MDDHWKNFNAWLKDVAEHRGMTFEDAEKLAHGRVWTGNQGKSNGLVDETGSLDRAVEVAKELAGIPPEEKVTLVHYPKRKGLLSSIFGGNADPNSAARWIIYRFLHEDLIESWKLLTERPLYIMDNMTIN